MGSRTAGDTSGGLFNGVAASLAPRDQDSCYSKLHCGHLQSQPTPRCLDPSHPALGQKLRIPNVYDPAMKRLLHAALIISAPLGLLACSGDRDRVPGPSDEGESSFQASEQTNYIKASNTDPEDFFGESVSLDGDTLVVGAYLEDSSATGIDGNQNNNDAAYSGAVYVFVRDGETWTQQAYIKASNAEADDLFGYSVSLSGDTLVVGALGEDSNATGIDGDQNNNDASTSGAAYVFVRDGDTWTQQAYIKASNTEAGDSFGTSVSLDGDTLVVGAWAEDSNATGIDGNQNNNDAAYSGAVYVFK